MIVGVDPSLSCTSIVAGSRPILEHSKSFHSFNTGDGVLQRLTRFDRLVAEVMTYLRGLPNITAIYLEGYSFLSKGRVHQTAEFGGLLRYYLLDLGKVHEVPPNTLKKFAWGKGKGDKAVVAASLARRYDLDLDSNDSYDAYACWRLGCVAEGVLQATTQYEEEAAATVRGMKSNAGQKVQSA